MIGAYFTYFSFVVLYSITELFCSTAYLAVLIDLTQFNPGVFLKTFSYFLIIKTLIFSEPHFNCFTLSIIYCLWINGVLEVSILK